MCADGKVKSADSESISWLFYGEKKIEKLCRMSGKLHGNVGEDCFWFSVEIFSASSCLFATFGAKK